MQVSKVYQTIQCSERIALGLAVGIAFIRLNAGNQELNEARRRGIGQTANAFALEAAKQALVDATTAFSEHKRVHGCC